MKILYWKALILTLVLVQIINAENMLKLYEKYFPDNILKNKSYRENINTTLKIYGAIDPSLIYYYITSLDLRFNQGISDKDSNFTNLLHFQVNKAKLNKKKWAQFQIEKMQQEIISNAEVRGISSYFSEFLFESLKEFDQVKQLEIDHKLLDYFIYIYFSRGGNLKYDSSLNYKDLYIIQSKEIINELNSAYNKMEQLNLLQKENLLAKAYEYSFLFKGTYLYFFPETTPFYFYEFIRRMFQDDYKNKHSVFLKISNEAIPITYDAKFEYTDYNGKTHTHNHDVTFKNTTYLHLGFQYALNETLIPFSFINVDLGFSINQASTINEKYTVLSSGLLAQSGLYYRWFYAVDKPYDFKTYSISSQITLPFYYFSRNLFFELGLNYTLRNYQYKFDFIEEFVYRKAYEGISIVVDEIEVVHVDEFKHSIYPLLAANFYILKFINLRAEYLIPLEVRIGLVVHVQF